MITDGKDRDCDFSPPTCPSAVPAGSQGPAHLPPRADPNQRREEAEAQEK